jgi:flagellar hook assembly protein FlgD
VYDLAGRRVVTILEGRAVAGPYAPTWDGKNEKGHPVIPGLYLIRIEIEVDEGTFTRIEPVGVAY